MKKETKEKQEKKEVVELATQSPQELAVYESLMDNDASDSRDIILPKILLMQGLSNLVSEGIAVMGEMRGSLEGNLLGNAKQSLEVIPIYASKSWILFEEQNGKMEYTGQVPFGPSNANWTWDAVENGRKVRRDQSINLFCVAPSEIESGIFMPYQVSFRRTSYAAGRKLITLKEKLKMFNRPLASSTIMLTCKQDRNDKGVFYIWDLAQGRATTLPELDAVSPWFKLLKSSNVKVDDSDLHAEVVNNYVDVENSTEF